MKGIIVANIIVIVVAVCVWKVPSFLDWIDRQFSDALPDWDDV